jgi:cyanophycinase
MSFRLLALIFGCALLCAQPKGTLVIAGGGTLPASIHQAFVQAAGGAGATVAVFPLASGEPDESYHAARIRFESLGLKVLRVDVKHRSEASLPDRIARVHQCAGFWFTGGDQKRIHDLLVGTPLHQTLLDRFAEGAAIGGTSAGAAMMSAIMIEGTDDVSEVRAGAYKTLPGMGFLRSAIVDQHFLRRSRHNRLLSLALDHPALLMIGIDEETALVITQDHLKVVGNRNVLVIDPRAAILQGDRARHLLVHLLGEGDTFDLGPVPLAR